MNFKRSLWGYSQVQVEQLFEERRLAFTLQKNQLESTLESLQQSGRNLNQEIIQLKNKCEQAYKQQQLIEASRPILEQLLQKLQEYTASQEQNNSRENAALRAELAAKTTQIEADQQKLILFWQSLYAKLGDLLTAMELEESTGKSLLNKYYSDLESQAPDTSAVPAPNVQEEPSSLSINDDWLTESKEAQEYILPADNESMLQLQAMQPEAQMQEAAQHISAAAADELDKTPQVNQQAMSLQAEEQVQLLVDDKIYTYSSWENQSEPKIQPAEQNNSLMADKVWVSPPREDQPGMELPSADLNENPDTNISLKIIPQDEIAEFDLTAVDKNIASQESPEWKAVLPDLSATEEAVDTAVRESLPEAENKQAVIADKPLVFNPFNTIKPDTSLVFDSLKSNTEPSAANEDKSLAPHEDGCQTDLLKENVSHLKEAASSHAGSASLSKHNALVLDHDATILAMLRIILQRDGFSISEYMDGYQASQNIDNMAPPMLAILEADAPIINALQLIRKIRSKASWEDCAIIVLTENASEPNIKELLSAGANDYINKPVNTRELVNRIRRHTGTSVMAL